MSDAQRDMVASEALALSGSTEASTAGALLRQGRQARGLHIAALAAAIKVTPRKLDSLENDRFDELPGPTFTRALAQTVCRSLKMDPAPVLALLPMPPGHGLEQMSRGLNAPFNDRPTRRMPGEASVLGRPASIAVVAILAAALLIYLLPSHWVRDHVPQLRRAGAASAVAVDGRASAVLDAPESLVVTESVSSSPSAALAVGIPASEPSSVPLVADAQKLALVAPTSGTLPAPGLLSVLQLRARGASWVEVSDGRGRSLLSRMVQPGEALSLDGAPPLRVKIGKANVLDVVYNGQTVNLQPVTSRDNIAKLELK
jgi:cytoskeleton protein RodZ